MALPPDQFDIAVEEHEGVVVVRPRGELDIATAPLLDEILRELGGRGANAVLDLSELAFIDSTGIKTVLTAYAASRRDGFGLTMLPGPPAVMRVLELSGVKDRLPFPPD